MAIVFGRTKRRVDELSKGLELRGYRAEGIHGDLTQQNVSVLNAFKTGNLDILVATDVLARGLDISGVTYTTTISRKIQGNMFTVSAILVVPVKVCQ